MTAEEVHEILDLAVSTWHKIAEDHGTPHCNCFRVSFGEALMRKYNLTEAEMIEVLESPKVFPRR